MKKAKMQLQAGKHVERMEDILLQIQCHPEIVDPDVIDAAESFLLNGIAETKRVMKNSRRPGRLFLDKLCKIILRQFYHTGTSW